jgi:hypothetical protein
VLPSIEHPCYSLYGNYHCSYILPPGRYNLHCSVDIYVSGWLMVSFCHPTNIEVAYGVCICIANFVTLFRSLELIHTHICSVKNMKQTNKY